MEARLPWARKIGENVDQGVVVWVGATAGAAVAAELAWEEESTEPSPVEPAAEIGRAHV